MTASRRSDLTLAADLDALATTAELQVVTLGAFPSRSSAGVAAELAAMAVSLRDKAAGLRRRAFGGAGEARSVEASP